LQTGRTPITARTLSDAGMLMCVAHCSISLLTNAGGHTPAARIVGRTRAAVGVSLAMRDALGVDRLPIGAGAERLERAEHVAALATFRELTPAAVAE
jgi:hypothetical protein